MKKMMKKTSDKKDNAKVGKKDAPMAGVKKQMSEGKMKKTSGKGCKY